MNDILINFLLPLFTGVLGILGTAYRNKQKKEKDILDNVHQVIEIQKKHIYEQEKTLSRTRAMLDRIELKYEKKSAAIRKAYSCKTSSDDCPVLKEDEKLNSEECENCEHNGQ